ncbi:MAG TPA: lipopolysaccharide kinase InaA family protein [Gemmataceae bacterium]|jgi:tRNA A-37 threonylcarbamoyl transferase component Bud32
MQLIDASASTLRWHVAPEYQGLLLDANGLRLEEWLRNGRARVVKHGPHRTVYRVDLPELSFYLKHYRLPNTRAWLRELVRPSKARMEHDRALAIAARGVPTITPLALGEAPGWGPGESGLITLTLDGTAPLNQFLETTLAGFESSRRFRLRMDIARSLGGLIARMHDAGIRHNDLHAGNVLIRLCADDQPSLYLIDLHAVHVGAPLDWNASRDNLVMLNRWFVMRSHRTDRLRFWQAYCRSRAANGIVRSFHPVTPSPRHRVIFPAWAKDLECRTGASNLVFWLGRDRRCLARNRYYRRIRTGTVRGFAVADLDRAALRKLVTNPNEPFCRPGVTILKDGRSSTVVEFDLPDGDKLRRVIYKRFRVASVADPWKALLRRSPALRSWVNGQGLRERCLPTPRPLAVFHRRSGGLAHEGYLVTEKIPDANNLAAYVASLSSQADAERRSLVRQRIEQLARLAVVMHDRGVCHGDLKAANVLVSSSPCRVPSLKEDFGPFCLIDLAGTTLGCTVEAPRRERDLTRLHASFHRKPALTRTDKLRFLRNYLRPACFAVRRQERKRLWKVWWRAIEKATQAKIARNERNGRPLA